MLDRKYILELIDERIAELDNGLYVVELNISASNVIHVELDKIKGGVSVNDCVSVSRNIEHNLDREKQDFELHVSSAGLDKPIRHINQYSKNIGRSFKVVMNDGEKYEGELMKLTETGIVVKQISLQKSVEKRRKIQVEEILELPFSDIKESKIVISFK
ncbi:MAG: ribosome assembly cofactor RimP [Crocinitomicaceae bacterium]